MNLVWPGIKLIPLIY